MEEPKSQKRAALICGEFHLFFGETLGIYEVLRVKVVGDPGIEPGVRLREGVTVPCHTLRPVAHFKQKQSPRFGHDYDLENRASTRKLPLTE